MLDVKEVDDFLDDAPVLDFLALCRAPIERMRKQPALHLQHAAGHEIIERAHAFEQSDVLKCPRNALRRGLMRAHPPAFLVLECDQP